MFLVYVYSSTQRLDYNFAPTITLRLHQYLRTMSVLLVSLGNLVQTRASLRKVLDMAVALAKDGAEI